MASMSPVKSSVNQQGYQNDAAAARTLKLRICGTLHILAGIAIMLGFCWVLQYNDKAEAMARPRLFVSLLDMEGLDVGNSLSPPAFHLKLDAQVSSASGSRCCNRIGGGNSMLRVSYHGMLLAWGHVPAFSVCGGGGGGGGGGAAVEAKDEAVLLREEVRALIQSEQHVVGKAQFDVEGEVAGLGYLRCKAFLLQSKNAMQGPCCQVHYYH